MKKVVIAQNISFYAWHMRLNLAKAIRDNGYEVIFVSSSDKSISPSDKSISSGDVYSRKIEEEFAYFDINISRKGMNPFTDLKTLYEFYKIYKEIEPDVVLNYTAKPNIYGTIACSMLNIKTINNIAGLGTLFVKQNFITKIAKMLYKYSQKNATKIFFQNRDDFEMFVDENLVEKSKCDILPGSGVDTKEFIPVEYQKEDSRFKFLLISRMLWEKGIGEYVQAAKSIKKLYKNVEFQLVGFLDIENSSAVSKEQMQEWVDNGYVNYLGTSDNIKDEIAKADCLVLPSFYREGTPRVLLEGASMAKPIITTDNVGCRDVVDDGINGYICKPKSAEDLASKMKDMLELSKDERIKMGNKGREKAIKEFDEKIVFDKYLKNIEEILR